MSFTRAKSITWRLTFLFVAASLAVLLLLRLAVVSSVEQHFEQQDIEVLAGKLELARHAFGALKSQDAIEKIAHPLTDSLIGHANLDMTIFSLTHKVIYETPNANFPTSLLTSSAKQRIDNPVNWTLGDQAYRGVVAEIPTAINEHSRVIVAISLNTAHHQVFMHSFLKTLWIFIICAAGLTGVLGWAAVRNCLAPLSAMRDQTQGITVRQLSHRLPLEAMPTELVGLALSLNDMLARLEEAFLRLSSFSSDIAHELRTPVSILMTQTQVALSRRRSDNDYRSILESNAEEFEHLSKMISDMLLLAKSENNLLVPTFEPICLKEEVLSLFDFYDSVAQEKGLRLVLVGDGMVSADRHMLRRALSNLLSNAVRHSTVNTTVQVNIQTDQEIVSIRVENTGDTIPREYLEQIFERFFRVDPSRQSGKEGTGLGLAITKSIISAHGGTISVASSKGLTSFTIKMNQAQ